MDSHSENIFARLARERILFRKDLLSEKGAVAPSTPYVRVHLLPMHFVHIQDTNTSAIRTVVGPATFTTQFQEKIVYGPRKNITIPPGYYCVIRNPVEFSTEETRKGKGSDETGADNKNVRIRHQDLEIRFHQPDFPLYPGEELVGVSVRPLPFIAENTALRMYATNDFLDDTSNKNGIIQRVAGEEWMVIGPCLYQPQRWAIVKEEIHATVLQKGEAVRLRAIRDHVDANEIFRVTGEEWLREQEGAFLPAVEQIILGVVRPYVLNEKRAIHLEATAFFHDDLFNVARFPGDKWLVTYHDTTSYMPSVNERVVVENLAPVTIQQNGYHIIKNPYCPATHELKRGTKKIVRGPCSFFIHPGEVVNLAPHGQKTVIVLERGSACHVMALDDVVHMPLSSREDWEKCQKMTNEEKLKAGGVLKVAGSDWLVYGPGEYIPPTSVRVIGTRQAKIRLFKDWSDSFAINLFYM